MLIQKLVQAKKGNLSICINWSESEPPSLKAASKEEHIECYKYYHQEQIKLFMAQKIDWPTQAWTKEERSLRKIMNKSGFKLDRNLFQDARSQTISYIEKEVG